MKRVKAGTVKAMKRRYDDSYSVDDYKAVYDSWLYLEVVPNKYGVDDVALDVVRQADRAKLNTRLPLHSIKLDSEDENGHSDYLYPNAELHTIRNSEEDNYYKGHITILGGKVKWELLSKITDHVSHIGVSDRPARDIHPVLLEAVMNQAYGFVEGVLADKPDIVFLDEYYLLELAAKGDDGKRHRSIIQMVDNIDVLEKVYKFLGLGDPPPPHITLWREENSGGIGLTHGADFEKYAQREVRIEELKKALVPVGQMSNLTNTKSGLKVTKKTPRKTAKKKEVNKS